MIKYRVRYDDYEGVLNEAEISSPNYLATAINEVDGVIIFGSNSLGSLDAPIRSKRLQIELLATENDSFEDLIESDEREWQVVYKRNGVVMFLGFLTSESVVQSFAVKERYISFDVIDPLAFLSDLAYVDNSTAEGFTGDEQIIKIIANCLRRCFPDGYTYFNIVDFVPYDYRSITPTLLETTYETGRFLKDTTFDQGQYIDSETQVITDCMTVLTRTLQSLSLCVTQINGNVWAIYPFLYDISDIDPLYINSYNGFGNDITELELMPFSTETIYSDGASYVSGLVHCNQNQQYSYARGIEKLSVDYEFLVKKQLLENPDFIGGVNGISMPGWAVVPGLSEPTDAGYLKIFKSLTSPNPVAASSITGIVVDASNIIKITGSIKATFEEPLFYFNVRLDSPNQVLPYYLQYVGETVPIWVLRASAPNSNPLIQGENTEFLDFEFELPQIPDYAELTVEIYAARNAGAQTPLNVDNFIELHNLDLQGSSVNRTGRRYDTSVGTNSFQTEQINTYLDTDQFNINANQIFKFSIGHPIIEIKDRYLRDVTFYSLGSVFSQNIAKARKRRMVFRGDIYGFVEPHKYIEIDGLSTSDFAIMEHSYDSSRNITSLVLEERRNAESLFSQTVQDVFANEIKPTIVS